ncbi:MAG TPA: gephyrin-like molybdotransferase Glp [Burkholderiaceae bacterium]
MMPPPSPPPLSLQQLAAGIAGFDPGAVSITQARAFIDALVPRVSTVEKLALRSALGRVLASDVRSELNVPAHDNAAMDGYALRGTELAAHAPTTLRVKGRGLAGQREIPSAGAGECVRIMTGAVMPAGLDTVVPQELIALDGDRVTIPADAVRAGDNRRRAGEDLGLGEVALRAGRVLRPADLGLLASLGRGEVAVLRRLRVAFFSTGDELRSIGEPLDPGCVYDSNRYTLWAMLQRLGVVETVDLGVVRDEPGALLDAFASAARDADAVITSGGVSVGEADHTRSVMAQLGEVAFWHIAMRPGRPMAIGRIAAPDAGGHQAVLFGLPGNPVAVMVTFYALVRDALLAMSGAVLPPLPLLRARAGSPIRKRAGRTEYQRGIVTRAVEGGDWQVRLTGAQGSGILRSMSEANGLVVLAHDQGDVAAGDWVDVLPFDGLV